MIDSLFHENYYTVVDERIYYPAVNVDTFDKVVETAVRMVNQHAKEYWCGENPLILIKSQSYRRGLIKPSRKAVLCDICPIEFIICIAANNASELFKPTNNSIGIMVYVFDAPNNNSLNLFLNKINKIIYELIVLYADDRYLLTKLDEKGIEFFIENVESKDVASERITKLKPEQMLKLNRLKLIDELDEQFEDK